MIRRILLALIALNLGCLPPEPIVGPMPNPNEKPTENPNDKPNKDPEDAEGKGELQCSLHCMGLPNPTHQPLLGAQIHQLQQGKYQPYAYALFEGNALSTINLQKGEVYRIVASWVGQGDWLGTDQYGIQAPFSQPKGQGTPIESKFVYSDKDQMPRLTLGGAYVADPATTGQRKWYDRAPIDRYSALIEGLKVDQNGALELKFQRVAFEMLLEAQWLEEGRVEIELEGGGKWTLEPRQNSVRSVSTLLGVADRADWLKEDYTEEVACSARWLRKSGERIDLGTRRFVVSGGSRVSWTIPSPL